MAGMAGFVALGIILVVGLMALILFPEVFKEIARGLMITLFVMLAVGVFSMLIIQLTGFPIERHMREFGVKFMARDLVVDFFSVYPPEYDVQEVIHMDTDADGAKEWVVFYQFDMSDGRNPYAGAIYDYDRGTPPILFPYALRPPDRDYLSEGDVDLKLVDLVPDEGEVHTIPELFVQGKKEDELMTDLTIFQPHTNRISGESPTNAPPRYEVIGNFRGDGGIAYDPKTHRVTVTRLAHDRSQLAVKSIYGLDPKSATYMAWGNNEKLSPPLSETVTFAFGMPDDIKDTPYPEKKVLAFYQLLGQNSPDQELRGFLTGEALIKFDQRDWEYFGFAGMNDRMKSNVVNLNVTELTYSPQVEGFEPWVTDMDEIPRYMLTRIAFEATVDGDFVKVAEPIGWVTTLIDDGTTPGGSWKIDRRANQ